MSRTLASIATLNINNVATISGLAKVVGFTNLPDDIIGLIGFYTLPNIISKNELKKVSNASKSKQVFKALKEQWEWCHTLSYHWKSYIQKYFNDSELLYIYNTLTDCRCCSRHQDYSGINNVNYLAKHRICSCACRHQKRWIERLLIEKGYNNTSCYDCDTELDWSSIQKKIATEHGDWVLFRLAPPELRLTTYY